MKRKMDFSAHFSTAKFGKIVAEMLRHAEEYLAEGTSEEKKERALLYARWGFEKVEPLLRGTSIVVDGVKFSKKHLPLSDEVKFSIKRVAKRVKGVKGVQDE